MTRLRKVSFRDRGWTRRRYGSGFRYLDEHDQSLPDADVMRCKALVIPPAWSQVWICRYPNGHLQAVGFDEAGRRQYLYHPEWRIRRDAEKFRRVIGLAPRLPAARRRSVRQLRDPELSRERVLACAFRLLDQGLFRIGSEDYAVTNGSFGLATIRREHVAVRGAEIEFDFPAKSGQQGSVRIRDRVLVPTVQLMARRRGGGEELLAYRDGGRWRDITSADINEYLKALVGDDFSAKDLRTWHATVLASVLLAQRAQPNLSQTAEKRVVKSVMNDVADSLGNTPSVARSAYVDPRVVELFGQGTTLAPEVVRRVNAAASPQPPKVEQAVITLLAD